MSRLMQQPDGSWTATRRVGSHTFSLFVRATGYGGYFNCTAYHSHTGIELADTIGGSRKIAVDRALSIAKHKLAAKAPTEADFIAALGPCSK